MYFPFLWRNAKGQSKSIIKRRWRWRTLKPCQIYSQTTNLIKNVHQNLSLSRLNGQDMIQRTSNVWIIRSSRWRNVNSSTRSLSSSNTCRRGRKGTSLEDAPLGPEGSTLKWAALCLRKIAPKGPTTWTGSPVGKSARARNNRILCIKIGWISACPMAELLWTSFKERRNKWGKLIDTLDMKAYRNTHCSRGMVWRWEIGHKEWHATLRNKYAISDSAKNVIRGLEPTG